MSRPFSDLSNRIKRSADSQAIRPSLVPAGKPHELSEMSQRDGNDFGPASLRPYSQRISSDLSLDANSFVSENGAPLLGPGEHSPSDVVIIDDDEPSEPAPSTPTILPSIKVISAASISSMMGGAAIESTGDPAPLESAEVAAPPPAAAAAAANSASSTLAQPSVFRELLRRVVRLDNPRLRVFCVVCQQVRSCLFRIDDNAQSKNSFICSEKCLSKFYSSRDDVSAPTTLSASAAAPTTLSAPAPSTRSTHESPSAMRFRVVRAQASCTASPATVQHLPVVSTGSATGSINSVGSLTAAAEVTHPRAQSVDARCSSCGGDAPLSLSSRICLQARVFCSAMCAVRYLMAQSSSCEICSVKLMTAFQGKFCVRFGSDIRQFCSMNCLNTYKRRLRSCCYCHTVIAAGISAATVNTRSGVKFLCSEECLRRYKSVQNMAGQWPVESCSVCSKHTQPEYQFLRQPDELVMKLCSTPCFKAHTFVVAQNSTIRQCSMCRMHFVEENMSQFDVQFRRARHTFCSQRCSNVFVITRRYIVSCFSCKVRKYNFDMFEVTDSGSTYCSALCLKSAGFELPILFRCNCAICGCSMETPIFLSLSGDAYCSNRCLVTANNSSDLQPVVCVTTSSSGGVNSQQARTDQTRPKAPNQSGPAPMTPPLAGLLNVVSAVAASAPVSVSAAVAAPPPSVPFSVGVPATRAIASASLVRSVPAVETWFPEACSSATSTGTDSVTSTVSSVDRRPLCSTGRLGTQGHTLPPYHGPHWKLRGVSGQPASDGCGRVGSGVDVDVSSGSGVGGRYGGSGDGFGVNVGSGGGVGGRYGGSGDVLGVDVGSRSGVDVGSGGGVDVGSGGGVDPTSGVGTGGSGVDSIAITVTLSAAPNVTTPTATTERTVTSRPSKRRRRLRDGRGRDTSSCKRMRRSLPAAGSSDELLRSCSELVGEQQVEGDSLLRLLRQLEQLICSKQGLCNVACQTGVLTDELATQTPSAQSADKSVGVDFISGDASTPSSKTTVRDNEDDAGSDSDQADNSNLSGHFFTALTSYQSLSRGVSNRTREVSSGVVSQQSGNTSPSVHSITASALDQVETPTESGETSCATSDHSKKITVTKVSDCSTSGQVKTFTTSALTGYSSSDTASSSTRGGLHGFGSNVLPLFVPVPVYIPVPIPDAFKCPYPVPVPFVVPVPVPVPVPILTDTVESANAVVRNFQSKSTPACVSDRSDECSNPADALAVATSSENSVRSPGVSSTGTRTSDMSPLHAINTCPASSASAARVSASPPQAILSDDDRTARDSLSADPPCSAVVDQRLISVVSAVSTDALGLDHDSSPCENIVSSPKSVSAHSIDDHLSESDGGFEDFSTHCATDLASHSAVSSSSVAPLFVFSSVPNISSPVPIDSSSASTISPSVPTISSSVPTAISSAPPIFSSSPSIVSSSPSVSSSLFSINSSSTAFSISSSITSTISSLSTVDSLSVCSSAISIAAISSQAGFDPSPARSLSDAVKINGVCEDSNEPSSTNKPGQICSSVTAGSVLGHPTTADDGSSLCDEHRLTIATVVSTDSPVGERTDPVKDPGSSQLVKDPSGLSGLELALQSVRDSLHVDNSPESAGGSHAGSTGDGTGIPTESKATSTDSNVSHDQSNQPADICADADVSHTSVFPQSDANVSECGLVSLSLQCVSTATSSIVTASFAAELSGSTLTSGGAGDCSVTASGNNSVDMVPVIGNVTRPVVDSVDDDGRYSPEPVPFTGAVCSDPDDAITVLSASPIACDPDMDLDDPDIDPDDPDMDPDDPQVVLSVESVCEEPVTNLMIDSVTSFSNESTTFLRTEALFSELTESRTVLPIESLPNGLTESRTVLSTDSMPSDVFESRTVLPTDSIPSDPNESRTVLAIESTVSEMKDSRGNSFVIEWKDLTSDSPQSSPLINCDNCCILLNRLAASLDNPPGEKDDVRQLLARVLKHLCSSDSLFSALPADRVLQMVIGVREWQLSRGQTPVLDSLHADSVFRYLHWLLRPMARQFITAVFKESAAPAVCVTEEQLWQCHVLGASSPLSLLSTVLYFNAKLLGMTDLFEHCSLRFHMFSLDADSFTLNFSHDEDDATSLSPVQFEPVANDPLRCPVQLFNFYMSKCPAESVKNRDSQLYLCPDPECTAESRYWFTGSPVPTPLLRVILYRLLCTSQLRSHLLGS